MKTQLEKVRKATKALGEAPYNDKKTSEAVSEGVKRALALYDKIKKDKSNK